MKNSYLILIILVLFLGFSAKAQGHFTEYDTIDVLHYDISLDMGHHQPTHIQGWCEVTLRMLQSSTQVSLGLMNATIDSILVDGTRLNDSAYNYNQRELRIPVGNTTINDTLHLKIHYGSYGWTGYDGGFWCDEYIFYNLGEDRRVRPFSMGRSWFPCKDSVYDRATYSFHITVPQGWTTVCSGEQTNVVTNADSSRTFHFELRHPISTYQVGISASIYNIAQFEVQGQNNTYPVQVASLSLDSSQIIESYGILEQTLNLYERLFGPYRWENIRFSECAQNGGMEHVNNIIIYMNYEYDLPFLIDHEFAHQWFGNLVTCDRLEDMWFNEGGATFADQLASENRYGNRWEVMNGKRKAVIEAPRSENGFHPLCGMPNEYSFQRTTYYKGAMVFHELRQLLGDSSFFAMIQTLLQDNAYSNLDSYQLRDSMSLFSGIDLTDFYDFHVFGTGFASYIVDSLKTTDGFTHLWLSQRLWHASNYCHPAHVPVTFFSEQGDTMTCQVISTGRYSEGVFQLPFTPSFAIVDYNYQTASTNFPDYLLLYSTEEQDAYYAQLIVKPTAIPDTVNMFMNLVYSEPEEELLPGLIRWDNRRWFIYGDYDNRFKAKTGFRFGNNYPVYDNEFYYGYSTKDSLRLFYRKDSSHPWKMKNTTVKYTESVAFGRCYYLQITNTPLSGEYMMAVVDTALLDINEDGELNPENTKPKLSVSPNPADRFVNVSFNACNTSLDKCYISVFNTLGKKIIDFKPTKNTIQLSTESWPSGIYFITITSPWGANTKKIIIQ